MLSNMLMSFSLVVKHALIPIKRRIKEGSSEKLADILSKWVERNQYKAEPGADETEHESRGRKTRMGLSTGCRAQA